MQIGNSCQVFQVILQFQVVYEDHSIPNNLSWMRFCFIICTVSKTWNYRASGMMFEFENCPSIKEFREMGHPEVKEFSSFWCWVKGNFLFTVHHELGWNLVRIPDNIFYQWECGRFDPLVLSWHSKPSLSIHASILAPKSYAVNHIHNLALSLK